MAALSLLQSNYTDPDDAQLESDIADQHHELDHDQDEDLPPRPTSRLGFNSVPAKAVAPESPPRSRPGLKWTRSLFQKIGIQSLASSSVADVDMDITAVLTSPSADDDDEDLDPLSLPILPSLASASASTSSLNLSDMDVDTGSSCDDEYDDSDSDGYSSGDSDIDLDSPAEYGQGGRDLLLFPPVSHPTALLPPSPSPPHAVPPTPLVPYAIIAPTTAPILIPPFSRRPTPSPSPPIVRTKYSCLPSPLSPTSDDRIYYTNPLRHAYGHHGRSRHALLHLKYLWSLREDQWDEHANLHASYAYCGMSPPPPRAPPLRPQHEAASATKTQPDLVVMPPMTIHPRRGDLSALRDPYCAHMDRCFVGLPLWTMGKTLWMYDVHMLTEGRARAGKMGGDGGSEDEESEGESMAASVSTAGFSDDSDETLVESESDHEEREVRDEALEDVDLGDDNDMDKDGDDDGKAPRSRPTPNAYLDSKRTLGVSCAALPPPPRWQTSWYKRWEILLELVRLDTEREHALQRSAGHPSQFESQSAATPCSTSPSLAVRTPRFFIGEAEEEGNEEENENDDSWSEERWDKVLGLGNSFNAAEDDGDDVMIVSSGSNSDQGFLSLEGRC
ncbi:hypothetical protein C8R44DRAFT_118971 [Mycena epipterygia]|nr:hypothetical protein C8R44DRAFT_118971 [Mycena epipterygia]